MYAMATNKKITINPVIRSETESQILGFVIIIYL